MENKQNFLFGMTSENDTIDQCKEQNQQNDIENLQKVVLQSYKYCQAKKSKNRYIRVKKIQQMKTYQKKLVAIVKKKSQQVIQSLLRFSNDMILDEQSECNEYAKNEQDSLNRIKQKIGQLKRDNNDQNMALNNKSSIIKQKLKRITFECEQELQKMQSSQNDRKSDSQIQLLINRMQRPFKKLCNYFTILNKQIKQIHETSTLQKSDSTQTKC